MNGIRLKLSQLSINLIEFPQHSDKTNFDAAFGSIGWFQCSLAAQLTAGGCTHLKR